MSLDSGVRHYIRYAFSADASIIDDAGDEIPAHVTDISFGGCRLFAIGLFRTGAEVAIKIRTATEELEATAQVVHCSVKDLSVIWKNVSSESLVMLKKWIEVAARTADAGISASKT